MTYLNWVVSSSVLIIAVLVLRAVFRKKLSAGVRFALWGIVLIRLLIPFNIADSRFSVVNLVNKVTGPYYTEQPEAEITPEQADVEPEPETKLVINYETKDKIRQGLVQPENEKSPDPEEAEKALPVKTILLLVWASGAAVTASVFLISNLTFYFRIRSRRERLDCGCSKKVYSVRGLTSSFLFFNTIYVDGDVAGDPEKLCFVLAHETAHARHLDGLWTILRSLCLTVHWFNPLVWAAAYYSRRDCELFADAGALEVLGEDRREDYGKALISLCSGKNGGSAVFISAASVSGGKKELRERILMISKRARTTALAAVILLLAVAAVVICVFSGCKAENEDAGSPSAQSGSESITENATEGGETVEEESREFNETLLETDLYEFFNRYFFNWPDSDGEDQYKNLHTSFLSSIYSDVRDIDYFEFI
ncbi:MAG: hypothetical protein IJS90_06435 [Clostridia bacterium]|nr:hypothetical protein [Clostridia bacterium]